MHRFFKILSLLTGYFLYFVVNIGVTLTVVPIAIFCNIFHINGVATHLLHRCFHLFFTKVLPLLGVIRFSKIEGLSQIEHPENAIYICNHRGMLDGPILISLVDNLIPTMKAKYAEKIGYRIMSNHMGFIKLDVTSPQALKKTEEKCVKTLKKSSILVFPEGTRKTSDRISDFKKLAFKLSADSGSPIVPIVLYNDIPFLGKDKGSVFPKKTVSLHVRFLPAIYPQNKRVNQLINEAYKTMSKELKEIASLYKRS